MSEIRDRLRAAVLRTTIGYRLWVRRNHGGRWRPLRAPSPRPPCAVLGTKGEVDDAAREVARIGLPRFGIREKWWDALGAVGTVLASAPRTGEVLDAGADFYSPILPWLHHYGYRRLRGCNLVFREPMARGRIRYEHGDVTATGYRDGQFSAVTCMSVIEHGVDPDRFFAEMARILRDGAPLVVSTDYWETPIDSGGKTEFGVPVKIFSAGEIPGLVGAAERRGLRLAGPLPVLAGRDRPIRWNDLEYTFLLLTFRKRMCAGTTTTLGATASPSSASG